MYKLYNMRTGEIFAKSNNKDELLHLAEELGFFDEGRSDEGQIKICDFDKEIFDQ